MHITCRMRVKLLNKLEIYMEYGLSFLSKLFCKKNYV